MVRRTKKTSIDDTNYERLNEEPTSSTEAEQELNSLCRSLRNPNFNFSSLPNLFRTYLLSLRLLGLDEKWAFLELKGYQDTDIMPDYRIRHCDIVYLKRSSDTQVERAREKYKFSEPLLFIVNNLKNGWARSSDGPDKSYRGDTVTTTRRVYVKEWEILLVLGDIVEELFDRASKTLVTAKFGSAIDTIFRDYQKDVNNMLSKLDIQEQLDTAYRNLKGSNEASWRAAALTCRNILIDLSDKLWLVPGNTYAGLFSPDGKPMSVKRDKTRNRIRAYMKEKGLDKEDVPCALLDSLYAQASAAKTESSYEDARSVMIVTYLFLAELMRHTDMKPIRKIKKIDK